MAATVARIAYAPVKGLGLAHPDEIELEHTGLRQNRRFYLVGADGRLANGKVLGTLVQVAADADADGTSLALRFPDGTTVAGAVALGDAVETVFYGRPVAGHVVDGPWSEALSAFAGTPLRLIRADEPGAASDRGAAGSVSLVSTASLERLAREAGVEAVDGRRFRMLFTIEGAAVHEEDGWVGRDVRVGAATLRCNGLVGRCAVTTHDPDTGVPSLDTLHLLRAYRSHVRSDEPLPFGVFGEVVRPGSVRVGDEVSVTEPV